MFEFRKTKQPMAFDIIIGISPFFTLNLEKFNFLIHNTVLKDLTMANSILNGIINKF